MRQEYLEKQQDLENETEEECTYKYSIYRSDGGMVKFKVRREVFKEDKCISTQWLKHSLVFKGQDPTRIFDDVEEATREIEECITKDKEVENIKKFKKASWEVVSVRSFPVNTHKSHKSVKF